MKLYYKTIKSICDFLPGILTVSGNYSSWDVTDNSTYS